MATTVKSPFSGAPAKLDTEVVELLFKGSRYSVVRQFYVCPKTGEHFVSPAQHDEVLRQLREAHRAHLLQQAFQATMRVAGADFVRALSDASGAGQAGSSGHQAADAFVDWSQSRNSAVHLAE